MAAAEVLVFTQSFIENGSGLAADLNSTTLWDDRFLKAQLSLVAKAWVIERQNAQVRMYRVS
jgi:hypothetical protein